ncbi:MAG: hypothetical protein MRY49_00500 [Candidatus Pacebacteria bacterium]|nr:hypothetical protein [Candidatus Paceibacterota bacterium]
MKKMTKNLYFYGVIAIIIVTLSIFLTVLFDSGYTVSGFSIKKAGTIHLSIDQENAWVFIDEEAKHTTGSEFETITIPDARPGLRTITVIKNGYIPWSKKVDIPSDGEVSISPFIVKTFTNPTGIKITDPEYFQVQSFLVGFRSKVKTNYSTEKYSVSAVGNGIEIKCIEGDCSLPSIETDSPVTGVYQYDQNDNVLLYSTTNSIYVSELDGGEKRITHMVYEGNNITFYPEGKTLFVKDKADLIKLSI